MLYGMAILLLFVLLGEIDKAVRRREEREERRHHAPFIDADMWKEWR